MRKILSIIILILLAANISAIRINEVELNPSGTDSGKEWIELYGKGDVDLGDYKLVNNDGDEIKLSGSFSKYYVYTFDKQWLDNTDERVFLYEGSEIVDETDLIDDEENDDKTWQFCDGDWGFADETEDGKNDCDSEEDKESKREELIKSAEIVEDDVEKSVMEDREMEVIMLNSKDIKREKIKKSLDKSDYALYGFGIFCVLLVALFVIRKKRFNKNEFE